MADIIATAFRFRQFLFEFGPLFLVSWLGLAVVFGLATVLSRRESGLEQQEVTSRRMGISGELYRKAVHLLWRLAGRRLDGLPVAGLLIFSLSASIPALVVTSLIGIKALSLRLVLGLAYAAILGWFMSRIILKRTGKNSEQIPEERALFPHSALPDKVNLSPSTTVVSTFAHVAWRAFTTQFNDSLLSIIIGFTLASALTIYIPAYWVRPLWNEAAWYGPYLTAALVIPLQLSSGADVPVAAALLVKGASLGAALSVMIAAPSTTIPVVMWLRRSAGIARATLYILVAWLVAGSLGVIVNLAQSLFAARL